MLTASSPLDQEQAVAIIGMGPRGLSVLERLVAHIGQDLGPRPLHIYTIDTHEHGAGRIWRTDQPSWLLMNTVVEQITIYGENSDGQAALGPDLHEWLQAQTGELYRQFERNDYVPRAIYGQYLSDAYRRLTHCLPAGVYIHTIYDCVAEISMYDGRYRLLFEQSGEDLVVDNVVLATGHMHNLLTPREEVLQQHVECYPHLQYLPGDAITGQSLHTITSQDTVALRGMGLTFYDIVAELTYGRGGHFTELPEGGYRYHASGKEPKIIAGSRSSLPFLARGKNQKRVIDVYEPIFLTMDALEKLRKQALHKRGTPQLDFDADILPLINLEIGLVYFYRTLYNRNGSKTAATFAVRFTHEASDLQAQRTLLHEFGLADLQTPNIEELARPFKHLAFPGSNDFQQHLLDYLKQDVAQANGGNVGNPLKAALDVLRDIRFMICIAVNFSGLLPHSQEDFERRYVSACALVSTGPPLFRVNELIALIEAGIVEIVGPEAQFFCDNKRGCFRVVSPQVEHSERDASVLIEAHLPNPCLSQNASPLFQQLLADGIVSEYINYDGVSEALLHTGGVAVTSAPYHIINREGQVCHHLYAIGIPTEHTQWFTQVGSSRPHSRTSFTREADEIACDILDLPHCDQPERGSIRSFEASMGTSTNHPIMTYAERK